MASERVQRHIDRLLDEVDEAMALLDWERVRERAQAVLALDRDNRDAATFLEAAEFALRSFGEPPQDQPVAPEPPSSQNLASEDPTSFADSRYQVKRFLGEGGKKKVYLAHDTT